MNEISIKSYTRRSKNGKTVTVKGYTRRVGKKGIRSPKKSKEVNPGDELLQKLSNPYLGPTMSIEEMKVWDDKARKASTQNYGKRPLRKPTVKKNDETAKVTVKKDRRTVKDVENKIASFVEKYTNKKYRRVL